MKQDRDWLLFSEKKEGTIEARLPIAEFPDGQAFAGKPVLLGIRPEDIRSYGHFQGGKILGSFPAIIDFVEATGANRKFYLQTGAHTHEFAEPCESMGRQEAGHRAQFQLNLGKVCLFDPVSGRRLVEDHYSRAIISFVPESCINFLLPFQDRLRVISRHYGGTAIEPTITF